MTQCAISGENLTNNITVLHAKIKCFEWMLQLILIARSNTTKKWPSIHQSGSGYERGEKDTQTEKLITLRQVMQREPGIKIGINTDKIDVPTDKMFKQMQLDDGTAKIAQMVHDDTVHEDFANILLWTCAVICLKLKHTNGGCGEAEDISHQALQANHYNLSLGQSQ